MTEIKFDYSKLNRNDKRYYDSMTDSEKQNFERIWTNIETQKARLVQQKNASRERANREQKVLAEKERKERNHRLIERGAILEAYIRNPMDFSNEQIKIIVEKIFSSEYAMQYIEGIRQING